MEQERFTVSGVMAEGWRVYREYFGRLLFAVLAVQVPLNIGQAFVFANIPWQELLSTHRYEFILPMLSFLKMLLWIPLAAFPAVAAVRERRGESSSFFACMGQMVRRVPGVIWAVFMGWIVIALRALLLVLPGVARFFSYRFVRFEVMASGRRGQEALADSLGLVRGRWWRVLGVYILLWLLCFWVVIVWFLAGLYFEWTFLDSSVKGVVFVTLIDLFGMLYACLESGLYLLAQRTRAPAVLSEDEEAAAEVKGPFWANYALNMVLWVLVPLGLIYGLCYGVSTAKPVIETNYIEKLNELNARIERSGTNGWGEIEKVLALSVKPEEELKEALKSPYGYFKTSFFDLKPEQQSIIRQFIQDNRPFWDQISQEDQAKIQNNLETNRILPAYLPVLLGPRSYFPWDNSDPEIKMDEAINTIASYVFGERDVEPVVGPGGIQMGSGAPTPDDSPLEPAEQAYRSGVSSRILEEWIRYSEGGALAHPVLGPKIRAYVGANEAAWQAFERASRSDYISWEYPCDDFSLENIINDPVLFKDTLSLLDLSRVGYWRSRMKVIEGDMAGATESCLCIIRVFTQWQGRYKNMFDQFVGISCCHGSLEEICRIAASGQLNNGQLETIQKDIEAIYTHNTPVFDYTAEKYFQLEVTQRLYSNIGFGGGFILAKRIFELSDMKDELASLYYPHTLFMSTALSCFMAKRQDVYQLMDSLICYFKDYTLSKPYEHFISKDDVSDAIEEIDKPRFIIYKILCPALERYNVLYYKLRAKYEGTIAVLALERYKLENGDYPETLGDLVSEGYMSIVPEDPFGPGALTYKKEGSGILLYSFGENCKDDGGVNWDKLVHPDSWECDDWVLYSK